MINELFLNEQKRVYFSVGEHNKTFPRVQNIFVYRGPPDKKRITKVIHLFNALKLIKVEKNVRFI